jgi:hypothetical protein
MSIHPTTNEIEFVCDSIKSIAENHRSGLLTIITTESQMNLSIKSKTT